MKLDSREWSMVLTRAQAYIAAPKHALEMHEQLISNHVLPGFSVIYHTDNEKYCSGEISAIVTRIYEKYKETNNQYLEELINIKHENEHIRCAVASSARMLLRIKAREESRCPTCGKEK